MDQADHLFASLQTVVEQASFLSREQARLLLDSILELQAPTSEVRLAGLLAALAARGENEDELAGFVDSLRAHGSSVPLTPEERARLVDTCGTGGDQSGTFNISTAAALVAAAAGAEKGILVAKHGNRAVTSRSGSADVLEALGVPVDLSPDEAAQALRAFGFAFLPAAAMQPAMRALGATRRALGVRTAFNIVGPMTNPAGAQAQVLGVYAERLVPRVARTLARLGTRHAFVVHGRTGGGSGDRAANTPGMDEFSLSGSTAVAEVLDGRVRVFSVTAGSFGLAEAPVTALAGGDARENAAILRRIFAGGKGPCRDVVVMNAGAVLVAAGLARHFPEGARLAEATLDAGKVESLVEKIATASRLPSNSV